MMIISEAVFVIALVHATLASLQLNFTEDLKNVNGSIAHRRKRDERWIWGNDNNTSHKPSNKSDSIDKRQNNEPLSSNSAEEYNPCNHLVKPKPDYSEPGRRISEVKCYEYIWEINEEEEKPKRREACFDYLRKKGTGSGFGGGGVGGRSAKPGEFPHMGAIGWKGVSQDWVFKCGSSIISSKFVLTAAHCSKASSLDTDISDTVPKIVRLGQTKISGFTSSSRVYSEDANIIRIIVHPDYFSPYKYFDIALIELQDHIKFFGPIQPACLWTQQDLGTSVSITGWGVTEAGSRKTSPDLQVVDLDLIDFDYCNYLLEEQHISIRHWYGLQDHQICAGKLAGGADACQGDSGGPLQIQVPLKENTSINIYHVIGITSFGIGCALPNVPGIYTRVSSFIDWIESVVWPARRS